MSANRSVAAVPPGMAQVGVALGSVTFVALTLLTSSPARAYCRTAVFPGGNSGKICQPAEHDDCAGTAMFWPMACPSYSVQRDASNQVDWDTADQVVDDSFKAWELADCGSGDHPNIDLVDLGPVTCSAREYNQSGGNANIIVFRDGGWPYEGQLNTLALTTVTYNKQSGEIYDADIEVNSSSPDKVTLTTSETNAEYDLQSILTHETGHFLGLAHSSEHAATMFAEYKEGSIDLRELDTDDIQGICAAYPPVAGGTANCDPTPRHGFKDSCGPAPAEEEDDGCAMSSKPAAPMGPITLLVTGLASLGWWRRRR